MPDTTVSVTIGQRVRSHIYGGGLGQYPDDVDRHGYGDAGRTLVAKLNATTARQLVTLTAEEVNVLTEIADDLTWFDDDDGAADRRAGRTLLARLAQRREAVGK